MGEIFRSFASKISNWAGSPAAFITAVSAIVIWLATGPFFGYSDTWQLVINTATTIVTFLMVFLIQNTQNRDARAMHLKLDELIKASTSARNELVAVEDVPDEELETLNIEFKKLHDKYFTALEARAKKKAKREESR